MMLQIIIIKEALNRIYMERWDIHRNSNPYSTSIGYTMCRYINWIDKVNVVCNIQYNKHMHMRNNNHNNNNNRRLVTLATTLYEL